MPRHLTSRRSILILSQGRYQRLKILGITWKNSISLLICLWRLTLKIQLKPVITWLSICHLFREYKTFGRIEFTFFLFNIIYSHYNRRLPKFLASIESRHTIAQTFIDKVYWRRWCGLSEYKGVSPKPLNYSLLISSRFSAKRVLALLPHYGIERVTTKVQGKFGLAT